MQIFIGGSDILIYDYALPIEDDKRNLGSDTDSQLLYTSISNISFLIIIDYHEMHYIQILKVRKNVKCLVLLNINYVIKKLWKIKKYFEI